MHKNITSTLALLLDIDGEIMKTRWWEFSKRKTLKDIKKPLVDKLDRDWKIWAELS